jgi:hypothetical protein
MWIAGSTEELVPARDPKPLRPRSAGRSILPMKRVPDTIKQAMRYKRIVASIAEVGIVEALRRAARHKDTGP